MAVAFAMKAMWHTGTTDILKPGGELCVCQYDRYTGEKPAWHTVVKG